MSEENIIGMRIEMASHKVPQMRENRRDKYITYGEDNAYPDYLLNLFHQSSTHGAIIGGKVHYIYGNGLEVKTGGKGVQEFFDTANNGESLNEVVLKIISDLEIYDGFAIQILWSRDGKTFDIAHIDFGALRSTVDHSKFYYSTQWNDSMLRPMEYLPFNPNLLTKKKDGSYNSQILYYKCYRPGVKTYPLPNYIGSVAAIETEIEIANFHLNNIKNGFWGGKMITFPTGMPTQQQQIAIKKMFSRQKTGTDNAGAFTINFCDKPELKPIVETLTHGEQDTLFIETAKSVMDNIFIGHKVTSPMLFGVRQEGQLGGRNEMIDAHGLFTMTYAQPRGKQVLDIINWLTLKRCGVDEAFAFTPLELYPAQTQTATVVSTTANGKEDETTKDKIAGDKEDVEAVFNKTDINQKIELFGKYGQPKSKYNVLRSRSFFYSDDIEASEREFVSESFAVADLSREVLSLIHKEPLITTQLIADALKVQERDVIMVVDDLLNRDLIAETINDNGLAVRTLTQSGRRIIGNLPPQMATIRTMYEYGAAPGMGDDVIDTTRDFCRELIRLNRLYTRDDIQTLTTLLGYDVWLQRGGWYHDRERNVNVPQCRHIWKQTIVTDKNN